VRLPLPVSTTISIRSPFTTVKYPAWTAPNRRAHPRPAAGGCG
jgi:hypothetical protein